VADRLSLSHRGRQYEAERKPTAKTGLDTGGAVWELRRDGAPLTTFPAAVGDSPEAVREKMIEWLRANEDRPQADVGRQ
jgi:hypothetical protein